MEKQSSFKEVMCRSFLAGAVAMALGFVDKASAENVDYQGPFVKLQGGVNFALDSDFDGSSSASFPSGEANLDTGAIVGLAAGYRFNRNFDADLEYVYRSNDIDQIEANEGRLVADGGDLASVAIMANGHYYFDLSDSWSPYIGLGVGFLQEIDSDIELVGIADQKDLEDQIFAWQAMIGAEAPLNESWRLYGEGRFMSAPGPDLSNSNGTYSVDYNNLSLLLGIGYQF